MCQPCRAGRVLDACWHATALCRLPMTTRNRMYPPDLTGHRQPPRASVPRSREGCCDRNSGRGCKMSRPSHSKDSTTLTGASGFARRRLFGLSEWATFLVVRFAAERSTGKTSWRTSTLLPCHILSTITFWHGPTARAGKTRRRNERRRRRKCADVANCEDGK